MCGGSGTRLWPLSKRDYPKQFLKLCNDKSLLQDTYLRMGGILSYDSVFVIGNETNALNIYNQIKEIDSEFSKERIFIEPKSLGTAPAIAFSIKTLIDKFDIDKNEQIIFLPSDHYIENTEEYKREMEKVINVNKDLIITIGIKPTNPETGYGYIKKGEKIGEFYKVTEFKEKPILEVAKEYIKTGEYVWNSAVYVFTPKVFIEECNKYFKEISDVMALKYNDFFVEFKNLKKSSIECDLLEKTDKIVVFEGKFDWSDVGSFDRFFEISNLKDNRLVSIDSSNVSSYSLGNKLVVVLGVDDINIIEGKNTILILKKGKSEDLKKVIKYLEDNDSKEL